jgi:uncharacterized membrane protein YfcA
VDLALIVAFVALGALVGFLAGLLGIGGGMTMVPLLTFVFGRQGFAAEHVVHIAVATATATILFTSIASAREHHRHGAVLWRVVAGMAPGLVVGSFVGPQFVGAMSTALLAAFFGAFVAVAATQILLDRKAAASGSSPAWSAPAARSCRCRSWRPATCACATASRRPPRSASRSRSRARSAS